MRIRAAVLVFLSAAIFPGMALNAQPVSLHTGDNPVLCSPSCGPMLEHPVVWSFQFADQASVGPIDVPSYWHESLPGLPSTGRGIYRLILEFKEIPQFDALEIGEAASAANVFWNGQWIGSSGRTGISRISEFSRLHPQIFRLPLPITKRNELRIDVSNFHARGGGILKIRLGLESDFIAQRMTVFFQEGALMGILSICGLFYLILYAANTRDFSYLLFFFFTVFLNLRAFASNSFLEFFFPSRDWTDIRLLAEYLTAFSILPWIFFRFLTALFPIFNVPQLTAAGSLSAVCKKVVHFYGRYYLTPAVIFNGFFILLTMRPEIYGYFQPQMVYFILAPTFIVYIFIFITAVYSRQTGSWIILCGFLLLFPAAIHDILKTLNGNSDRLFLPAGMLFFAVSLAFTLGYRHTVLLLEVKRSRQKYLLADRRLKNNDRIKNNFILNTSRDMQGPLYSIVDNALELLDQKHVLSSHGKATILKMVDQGKKTLRYYDRIGYYLEGVSQGESARVDLRRDFEITAKILEKTLPGLTFRTVNPCSNTEFHINRNALNSILTEIAENVYQHSEKKNLILEAEIDEERNLILAFYVEEILPENFQDWTEEFFRSDRQGTGAGLGLSITQKLAEMSGGTFLIQNSNRAGFFEIRISLPDQKSADQNFPGAKHARFLIDCGFFQQALKEIREIENGSLRRKLTQEWQREHALRSA